MNQRSSSLAFTSDLISLALSVISGIMHSSQQAQFNCRYKTPSATVSEILLKSAHSDQQSSLSSLAMIAVLRRDACAQNHCDAHMGRAMVLISSSSINH